jgi:hypothetical protein
MGIKKIMGKKFFRFFSIMVMTFFCVTSLTPILSDGYTNVKAEEMDYPGLKGEYYTTTTTTSADFAKLVSTHADETINFYNGFTNILKQRTGRTEGCAVRWTGRIQPKYSETYTFHMIGDNGFRLWIDNKLVIDHWVNDWEIPQTSTPITLTAGTKYDFKLEYFQATGGADLKLEWSSASQTREVIPVQCLFQPVGSQIPIITSIDGPITATCQQYARPQLPEKVTVNYIDGTKKELPVVWDLSNKSLFEQVGTVQVTGNITGTAAQAVATVTVTAYAGWQKQKAPLMTQWAAEVSPENALTEYPRMQMQRNEWMNLNGLWQFKPSTAADTAPFGQEIKREILVPYPMESALSGVMNHYDRAFYRKTFTVPENWNGQKIILNFGAVDWESEVFVNGKSVGIHQGGYDPFSYDVTSYLTGTGPQELIVRVYDPTDAKGYPRGKQTLYPGGIMYTATTGIWQTVWLEPVAATASIDNLKIEPDVDGGRLKLTVNTAGTAAGTTVTAAAMDGTTVVGTVSGDANTALYIPIPNAKLWSPENPFLYDLKVDLKDASTTLDTVKSYFGMRKISMRQVNGVQKIFLNDKDTFLMGPLDQGFWPDGIYTAPTDAALKYDIEQTKALGFNMIRKHIKVEPARWYYWADKLGIMVWQDMPSENSYTSNPQPLEKAQYELELKRMVESNYNVPSIVMWCIFNEDQGQYDPARLVDLVKGLDSSRLINQGSGGPHANAGDILDVHSYPPPACPTSTTQARVCGEYGGTGLAVENHQWNPSGSASYIMVATPEDVERIYDSYATTLTNFKTNNGLCAAVYTETTDVETEVNGFMNYDRVMKVDVAKIKASNEKIINKQINYTDVLPTSQGQKQTWKYTTSSPSAEWYSESFDDASWNTGLGGFGTASTPAISIGTTWNTSDIWLRKSFNPGALTAEDLEKLVFFAFYDEDTEIYINGVLAGSVKGYTSGYTEIAINEAGKAAIIPNGNNVIAVHCHQTTGGQGIDVGIRKVSLSDGPIFSSSFTDNFDGGNANQWANYGGTWTVTNNAYAVASNSGAKAIANNTNFTDFTYETDIKVGTTGSNTNAGVLFRISEPGVGPDKYRGYYAGIGTGQDGPDTGVTLGKANGSWTPITFEPIAIVPNQVYHMKVTAVGSSIKVYIDDMDTPVLDVVDTSYISGAIGMRTWNLAAEYDNVSVKEYVPQKNTDATLSDLKVGDATVAEFNADTTTYNVELPAGTTTAPEVTAVVTDLGKATAVVTQAAALPGAATVVVTAEDGVTSKTYTVNFTVLVPKDTDATLKSITINGKALEGFMADKYEYKVTLPSGTTSIPVVGATATKESAVVEITQASTTNSTAAIKVTAEDGATTKTYAIKFIVASRNDATLNGITVNGKAIEEFRPELTNYDITIPYTTQIPMIEATASDANAEVIIKQAHSIHGQAMITVIAADGKTKEKYKVSFTVS